MPFRRKASEPPPGHYADEPVLHRTGPHWIGTDMTLGLGLLIVLSALYSYVIDPTFWRFIGVPAAPFLIRLAVDIPRFWHFDVVLTSRRLVIDVGIVRDVYHTLKVAHITDVRCSQNPLGSFLGYGDVEVTLDAVDGDGVPHHGTYSMDFVRRPGELYDAIVDAMQPFGRVPSGAPREGDAVKASEAKSSLGGA